MGLPTAQLPAMIIKTALFRAAPQLDRSARGRLLTVTDEQCADSSARCRTTAAGWYRRRMGLPCRLYRATLTPFPARFVWPPAGGGYRRIARTPSAPATDAGLGGVDHDKEHVLRGWFGGW